MAAITESQALEVLKSVRYPGFSRDIVSFGLVKGVRIDGNSITVQMSIATNDPKVPQAIKDESERALGAIPGISGVRVLIDIQAPAQGSGASASATQIDGVRHVIAIASGKGGVGKSTVAANLAVALDQAGARVGLCDCDLYGPSMGLMFDVHDRPMATEQNVILPITRHGVKLMSMGFLLDDDAPAILRGPMVTRYTQQFLRQVDWGGLDFLVLDLPPGTGDIQLTIVQTVALAGAVIVTTPQEVALVDARKAASMFARVNVPVLGLIENMSYFVCPKDNTRYDIFGRGGGEKEARRLGVPLLGQVPIDIPTRECGDRGKPIAISDKKNPASLVFAQIARTLREFLPL
ncbi:MAG: Mrp/NBP35 family ATP-binding protein [Chthoniobacteraceae bacterium]|jgi:ATP-binding protein involved in chromosome partitioning